MGRAPYAAVMLLAAGFGSAQGQLRGTVTDESGRALPFATVVSRTGNGFLAVRADLDGRFAFPDRVHRPGHAITVTSTGYHDLVYRLQERDTVLGVRLVRRDGPPGPGWAAGLPDIMAVTVIGPDDRAVVAGRDTLELGAPYRVRLALAPDGECHRSGPGAFGGEGTPVVLSAVVFSRGGADCRAAGAATAEVAVIAPSARPVFRVVGRYRDVMVDFRTAR